MQAGLRVGDARLRVGLARGGGVTGGGAGRKVDPAGVQRTSFGSIAVILACVKKPGPTLIVAQISAAVFSVDLVKMRLTKMRRRCSSSTMAPPSDLGTFSSAPGHILRRLFFTKLRTRCKARSVSTQ